MMCLKQFGWDLGLVFCNNSIYVHIELFKIYIILSFSGNLCKTWLLLLEVA